MAACSRFMLYVVAKSLNKSCMLLRAVESVDTGYYMLYVVACSRYRLCLYTCRRRVMFLHAVDIALCCYTQ